MTELQPGVVWPQFDQSPLQIAIVGCGPRGLQCLESLSRHLPADGQRLVSVTVFETAEFPGAGSVYNPRQPHYLRMNFAAEHIDFWKISRDQHTDADSSLLGWLRTHHPQHATGGAYVPRAVVGEYLRDCFQQVEKLLAQRAFFEVLRYPVSSIQPAGDRWRVQFAGDDRLFDEVVLTVGHEGLRASPAIANLEKSTFAFDLEKLARLESRSVLVRGFGLTAIDAVLSLSEGRGGSFVTSDPIDDYVESGYEPELIYIQSRSGRPMLAKPAAEIEPIADHFWEPFRDRFDEMIPQHGSLRWQGGLFDIFCDAAVSFLSASNVSDVTSREVEDWLQGWSRYRMDAATARQAMLQSLELATGRRPKDIPFALGEAWRRLYPQLVRLVSYGGLADAKYGSFRRTATEMERIAFGPPAENVRRLLALMKSRRLRLVSPTDSTGPIDHVVDAVIASPYDYCPSGPLMTLEQAGCLERDGTTGAIRVDAAGYAEGVVGLAVFGRATEGWILGNDTLTRTMHPQMEQWAATIQRKLLRSLVC